MARIVPLTCLFIWSVAGTRKAALVPVMGIWLRRFAPAAAVRAAGAGATGTVHGHVLWRWGTLAWLVGMEPVAVT